MKDYDKESVIQKLKALDISPKRSLGQNFLIGRSVVERILQAVKQTKPSQLIEVGPGLGALTEPLVEMGLPFKVVELDRKFAEMWRQQDLDVREGDALKMDWKSFQLKGATLVSNLPYQISSSIVIDRTVEPLGVDSMVLMFQKEVAQRIMALNKSKEYGLLTVMAQSAWEIKNVLEAGPNEFYPPPNVASRVLSFRRKPEVQGDLSKFLKFVKLGFAQRRKLLLSNLKPVYVSSGSTRDEWEVQLIGLGYKPGVRAEEVSVEHWLRLYERFIAPGTDHGN